MCHMLTCQCKCGRSTCFVVSHFKEEVQASPQNWSDFECGRIKYIAGLNVDPPPPGKQHLEFDPFCPITYVKFKRNCVMKLFNPTTTNKQKSLGLACSLLTQTDCSHDRQPFTLQQFPVRYQLQGH